MPDPRRFSGLLKAPSLPGLPKIPGVNQDPAAPFLPTEQDIQFQQQQLEAEDDTSLFFKVLQIPERLLGGQSIKAFIKGTAEGGLGQGLEDAFRNNPLFQVLDALPGVDIVEDVSFEDVRNAIGEDFLRVDNQLAQVGIDLVGELLTDPLGLIWTPFAKLPGFAGKVSADLGVAVEQGAKTLLAFKVPFTEKGFTLPIFKSFDVFTARALQGVANTVNSNPLTAKLLQVFNAKQVQIASPDVRASATKALEEAQKASRANDAIFLPMLNKAWTNLPDEVKKDPEVLRLFLQMVETGVQESDELSTVIAKIKGGRPLHLAQKERSRVIDELRESDDGLALLDLLSDIGPNGEGAGILAEAWQNAMPRASLPEEILDLSDDVLAKEGVVLRPGIDKRDPVQGAPNFIDPGIKDAVPTTVRSREVVQRADIADETTGVLEDVLTRIREEELPETLQKVLSSARGESLLQEIQGAAEDFVKLADEVGDADRAAGILRGSAESYFPRDLTPEVRSAIERQIGKTDFTQGRKLEELTIIEANALLLEHGAKVSGFRSVQDLMKDPDAVNKLWARIFPDEFLESLKELGPSGRKAAEFFQTNPLRAWYGRIRKSSEILGLRKYTATLLEEGSPIVTKRANLKWVAENPDKVDELVRDGYVFIARSGDTELGVEVVDGATLLDHAFNVDAKGKGLVAEKYISRWVDRELEAGKDFSRTVEDLRELRNTVVRNRSLLKPGAQEKAAFKAKFQETVPQVERSTARLNKRIETLNQDLKRLEESPFADHPLVQRMRNQRDLLQRWDDAALDAVSPVERQILETPDVSPHTQKLLEERVTRRRETVATRNQVASRLAELRKQKKAIGADPTKAVQRGLLEQEIRKTSQRLERLRKSVKGQDLLISKAKKAARGDKKTLRDLKKEIRAKGIKARNDALKDIDERVRVLREGVQAEIDRTLAQWKAVKSAVKEVATEAKGTVRGLVRGQVDETTTRNLNDYMRLYRRQKESGVLALDEIREKFPKLYDSMLGKNSGMEVMAVDGQVFKELFSRDTGVLDRLSRPTFTNGFLGFIDHLTAEWKAWTVLPPFFVKTRIRDMLSGFVMQLQGGTAPWELGHGARHVKGFIRALGKVVKGKDFDALKNLSVDERILKATGAADAEGVLQFLYSRGVVNNGLVQDAGFHASSDIAIAAAGEAGTEAKTFGQAIVDGAKKAVGTRSALIQSGADLAEAGDNAVKLSAFFGRVINGQDAETAARAVRNWSYDPRLVDLSHIEKTFLRRLIPFYSWTKRAVQMQTKAFLEKPGTVAFWEKLSRASQDLSGLTPAEYELVMPEFIKDNFGIPTESSPDGTVKVKLLGGLIPLFEAGRIADALADTFDPDAKGGIGQQILLNMNPLLKVPLENAINESFYTQRKLEDFPGETESFMGIEMDPKLRHTLQAIRFLKEIDDLNILDLSQLQAMFKVEGKDLLNTVDFSDGGAVPQPFRAPTTAADRLFSGGFGFDPRSAGGTKFISAFDQARRKEASLKLEKNRLRGQLNRLLRLRQAGGRVSDEELEALKGELAKKVAELRVVQNVQQRFSGVQ